MSNELKIKINKRSTFNNHTVKFKALAVCSMWIVKLPIETSFN